MRRLLFTLPCSGAAFAGGRRAVVDAGSVRCSFRGGAAPLGARLGRLARLGEAPEQPDWEALGHDSFITRDEEAALPAREAASTRRACVAHPVREGAPAAVQGLAPTPWAWLSNRW